jgi:hypothetical protein
MKKAKPWETGAFLWSNDIHGGYVGYGGGYEIEPQNSEFKIQKWWIAMSVFDPVNVRV